MSQKLNQYDFVAKLKHLDDVEEGKALHVRAGKPMNMFDPSTWSKCMTEFWFGDALPNDDRRPRKITFEQIFAALPDRDELEYHPDS